jgi:hypothetical protein
MITPVQRKPRLVAIVLAALSLCGAADALAQQKRYAVLSLIGDELMLSGAENQTGGRLDRNPRKYIEITDPFADKAALLAVHEVLKETRKTEPTLLFGRDRRLYQTQARLLDSGESMEKLLADIKPLLANTNATHLILITKDRREARIKFHDTTVGHGQLQGVGYYVDREMEVKLVDTGETAVGFVAAFAYFNMALIALENGKVLAEQRVNASMPYTTPTHVDAEDIWGRMPAVDRVRMLRELVGREVRAATPKLLSESD